MHLPRAGAAALAGAVLTVLTACAGEPVPATTPEQQRAALQARPDLTAALADLEGMLAEVRGRLDAELGIGGWSEFTAASPSGCAPQFPDVPFEAAATSTLANWGRDGPVPDADWPAALAILAEVSAARGFAAPVELVDRPGQHEARVDGPYGAQVALGTSRNTTMGGYTGCHRTPG